MLNVHEFIHSPEFAVLPDALSKILELYNPADTDIKTVSDIIETDENLSVKLLRVVNLPVFALGTEVKTLNQTIEILGKDRFLNIVVGVSIFSNFYTSENKAVNSILEDFWWHSSCVGMIAKSIIKKTNKSFDENEFIGGLLHDIGKLALIEYDVEKYFEVIRLVEEEKYQDIEAENYIFSTDHTIVGEEIAKLWKLPEQLSDIINFHNNLNDLTRNQELVASVRIADMISEIWGAGFHEGIRALKLKDEPGWKYLLESFPNLSDLDIELFTFGLESDFKKTVDFIKVIKS
ncbi:MAG: HDOD domain-containing protein [Candidatus Kapabacteria bacterium]|nr:HDOD domain-containing protein [Candidatus Kapabacteria bacterium]